MAKTEYETFRFTFTGAPSVGKNFLTESHNSVRCQGCPPQFRRQGRHEYGVLRPLRFYPRHDPYL